MIAVKTPESREKFAQKFLEKNSYKWGIYRPQKNIAVGSRNALPVDRPTVKFCPLAATGRPPRSTQTNRELCSQTRSTRTVDRPCLPNVHRFVHVGRPTRSTDFKPSRLVRRLVDWLKPGTENWVRKTV